MKKVVAFLLWLLSFWTWKDFFRRWFGRPSPHPAGGETAEHLASEEGPQESEFARFLSSLPANERRCNLLNFFRDSEVDIGFGRSQFKLKVRGTGAEASNYREFLGAVSSSEIVFDEEVCILVWEDDSYKYVEAFAEALRQAGKGFRKLELIGGFVSVVPFAKCASSVLLGNDAMQELRLKFVRLDQEMGKEEAAEFVSMVVVPHNLRILKSFSMYRCNLDGEGLEQLLKPFQDPSNVLEELSVGYVTSDDQLEQISITLASSTSLKTLEIDLESNEGKSKAFIKGYTSLARVLGSNQSLQSLCCEIFSSMELKVLLDPLMPKNNNLQSNTTLTKLTLWRSIGGQEGIQILVDMLCSNTSLLELNLKDVDDFSTKLLGEEGVANVLIVLEALKTNKSLKRIGFGWCKGVGGYKVLGAMMDLFLENHQIEDIDLQGTSLMETGDAEYVYSALSKRKKMNL